VIVNPYSREEMSEALKVALTMGQDERVRRWERLYAGLRESDVKSWRDAFVEALRVAREPPLPLFPSPMAQILAGAEGAIEAPRAAPRRNRRPRRETRPVPPHPTDA
jgi:hypothetical protein